MFFSLGFIQVMPCALARLIDLFIRFTTFVERSSDTKVQPQGFLERFPGRVAIDHHRRKKSLVAGPINIQIDKQYLTECNDQTFLTSVVVDCHPSGKTFEKPLGLDFRVGGPLYEGSESDEEADEPGEGAGHNLDEAQREEHMKSLRDMYKVS